MPRRQILSSEEQERLLVIPDDEIILTRMCFLNEPDIALINKHRRPANRLGFAVLLCYLRGPGFIPDKSSAPHNGVDYLADPPVSTCRRDVTLIPAGTQVVDINRT